MVKNLKEILKSLLWLLYILVILYIAYQVLKAIIGGTWTTENIIISGLGLIIAGMFSLFGILAVQSRNLGKLEERTKYLVGISKDFEKRIINLEKRS
ncbi:hypothetical protein HYX16_05305 [Candidatus Woesearchaeota archaeon]|nr:hypothetical protein [Candidatus Woesearchaeota archaeon]